MTRYQLAKIVEWAGTLQSRKRMQKVVFLLQTRGCPIEADFTLHHYGPYSQEVARLSDEMVQGKILEEWVTPKVAGEQYSYAVSEDALRQISELEAHRDGAHESKTMAPFEGLARELLQTDLRELEVASTIVFFRKQGHPWSTAVDKTCQFKGLPTGTPVLQNSERLARRIIA